LPVFVFAIEFTGEIAALLAAVISSFATLVISLDVSARTESKQAIDKMAIEIELVRRTLAAKR